MSDTPSNNETRREASADTATVEAAETRARVTRSRRCKWCASGRPEQQARRQGIGIERRKRRHHSQWHAGADGVSKPPQVKRHEGRLTAPHTKGATP
jgi:hypothetical protein